MRKLSFNAWTIPFALLMIIILGFGLFIRGLGFFQDDWYLAWMGHHYGPQIYISFFSDSRPFLAMSYMLTTKLIGTSTLAWQIFNLAMKWLAVLAAWWALRLLWPMRIKEVTWIAILLAIYPGFKQHYLAVVYSNVYLALAAFFFSLGAMLLAIRQPRWRWPLTALALLAAVFNLVTTEYFFGLELFRPIFLWMILGEQTRIWRKRVRLTFLYWAPYLAATAAFLIWRVFFFTSYMYGAELATNLNQNPLVTVQNIFQILIQDALEANLFAWLQTLDFAKSVYPTLRPFLINWGIVILSGALVAFYLLRLRTTPQQSQPTAYDPSIQSTPDEDQAKQKKDNFSLQAIFLGIYSVLIVGWPYWYAGLQIDLNNGADRFTMAYMFGSAILIVGLLDLLIKRDRAKIIIVSILVGAAVLFQIKNAQAYQHTHNVQAALFRDLVWRAPGLKPGAKLLINDVPVDFTGNASMNAAMNWVYAPDERNSDSSYRLFYLPFKLGSEDLPDLGVGSHTAGSVVAFYEPPGCVQVIDPSVHNGLPRLSESISEAIPLSDLRQIQVESQIPLGNYRKLFGKEPKEDWCYYFEKADLARQIGDWERIVTLGDQAFQANLKPYDKFSTELLPFIEGYGRLERWQDAFRLSEAAIKDIPALEGTLCNVWKRISLNTPQNPEKDQTIKQIKKLLNCSLP